MKTQQLWINQIKGLCICLVVIYHSVITFYPALSGLESELAIKLAKAWTYLNLYLAPFRMPVFFFISGFLVRRYLASVPWKQCLDKRVVSILYVLLLWGLIQWLCLTQINHWLAPERDLSASSNAAYATSPGGFLFSMLTASTSLWYLYALVIYFVVLKPLTRWHLPVLLLLVILNIGINFLPLPWWGMNSILRNMVYYALGAWCGEQLIAWMRSLTLRRALLPFTVALGVSLALWLSNVALVLSLLSILFFMVLFYRLDQMRPASPSSLLNVVGSNTLAIYTTHRILVEIMSLSTGHAINQHQFGDNVTLMILVFYPAVALLLCVGAGLAIRSLSKALLNDVLFTAPKPLQLQSATR